MELKNQQLSEGEFRQEQQEVLKQWPSGEEVDFGEAVEYQKAVPGKKRFAERLAKAREKGETLIQPRAGVALVNEHISLLQYLEEEGGADLLPTTIDSYTRQNRYQEAENGIQESKAADRSLLNGFPAVNHGVECCRMVNEKVGVPVQVRHGTPDARLLAEICLAGGFTAFEGGGISYNIPYAKSVPLDKTIRDWQYVDRLVGLYEEAGVTINREPFGPLTGTLVPPCISHVIAIVESILAAEQGVKSISVGYGQGGNLVQDVAAVRTLVGLTQEYLEKYGYQDRVVTTVLHQWMGGFPQDEAKAFGVISWGSVAAVLAGATKVIVKTPHEAFGVPTKEANANGLKATSQLVCMLADQRMVTTKELDGEMEIITAEVHCIMDKIMDLGKGDVAVGIVKAFAEGVVDVPFAPSKFNHGKIMPARDNHGAIRLLDWGNLPFNRELQDFHRDKISERARTEKREVSFQMVIDDIYAISKGRLVGRPK